MKYFFVLGTNTSLSLAELAAVLDLKKTWLISGDFLLWETETEINPESLMKRLGGVIKIGKIIEKTVKNDKNIVEILAKIVLNKQKEGDGGKFNFGFSDYGKLSLNKRDLGMKLKKRLSELKISSRFVVSRERTLSSVVVEQNKLLRRGIELVFVESQEDVLIGETLAVQPFKDLSRRDYGRPARDDLSGMIPPKLAQIMLNLAQISNLESVIVDPFCGSGTILSEAILMGYKNIFGSDLSKKAVDDTYKNISWIKELYQINDVKVKLVVKNVVNLSKFIKADFVEAIVTEPFLGPQRGLIDFKTVISNLESLYSEAISQFKVVLKTGGRVVMVWPFFYGQKPINPDYGGFKMVDMLPLNLKANDFIKKHNRATIIYGRPGQKVYREIVVLEKI